MLNFYNEANAAVYDISKIGLNVLMVSFIFKFEPVKMRRKSMY